MSDSRVCITVKGIHLSDSTAIRKALTTGNKIPSVTGVSRAAHRFLSLYLKRAANNGTIDQERIKLLQLTEGCVK